MSRQSMRALTSISALAVGGVILLTSLFLRFDSLLSIAGGLFTLFGVLGLLGFNVFRGSPLDPAKDPRGEQFAQSGFGMNP